MTKRIGETHLSAGDFARDANSTAALLKINGQAAGVFTSGEGSHAEDEIIDYLLEYFEDGTRWKVEGMRRIVQVFAASKIDIFITRSPCNECAPKLIAFVTRISNAYPNVRLRLFCATIWKGNAKNGPGARELERIRAALGNKVRLYRWDFLHMATKNDISSVNLLHVLSVSASVDEMMERNVSRIGAHKLDTRIVGIPTNALPDKARFGREWNEWYEPDEQDRMFFQ
jgi:hypothetical protein